jgi:hypothetical protein
MYNHGGGIATLNCAIQAEMISHLAREKNGFSQSRKVRQGNTQDINFTLKYSWRSWREKKEGGGILF